MMPPLSDPCIYFPPRHGRYDVAPGLFRLGTPFGNETADARLFQFDNQFDIYRRNKQACRLERRDKYVCVQGYTPLIAAAVARLIITRLLEESPDLFRWEEKGEVSTLFCQLTGDRLTFDADRQLVHSAGEYNDAFDALGSQVQEDVAVVRCSPEVGDCIAALHLCAPSHWAAEEKIGKSFVATHQPVPHFEKVAAAASALNEAVLRRGPFVRFTWGIDFSDHLNQHPEPPPGKQGVAELRQSFDPQRSPLYLRVERQVLWGLPEVDAYLFAIRVYHYDARALCRMEAQRNALLSALRSMSSESRRYKGIGDSFDAIIEALTTV